MPNASDFEKLGVFYLGRTYDCEQKKARPGRRGDAGLGVSRG
jgi:hypothetical protein